MAEQKLSARTEATSPSGGFFHVIRDVGSGLESFKISFANLFLAANTAISQLQTDIANRLKIEKKTSVSAATTFSMPNASKLESIDFYHISSTVTVKVGTAVGLDDIVSEFEISVGAESVIAPKLYPTTGTLYITVSGGTVNININYRTGQ